MIEETEEIAQQRAEVARHTRDLEEAVEKLKQATKRPLGLAERIREDPLLWLSGALLAGLVLGSRNHRTGDNYGPYSED